MLGLGRNGGAFRGRRGVMRGGLAGAGVGIEVLLRVGIYVCLCVRRDNLQGGDRLSSIPAPASQCVPGVGCGGSSRRIDASTAYHSARLPFLFLSTLKPPPPAPHADSHLIQKITRPARPEILSCPSQCRPTLPPAKPNPPTAPSRARTSRTWPRSVPRDSCAARGRRIRRRWCGVCRVCWGGRPKGGWG